MTKIKITTTQNIDIEYDLATVFERIVAWVIDFFVIIGYILIATTLTGMLFDYEDWNFGWIGLTTPALLYHFLSEWLLNGRSLGKMAMRIKVVRLDGSPPHVGNYLIRWVFRLIDCDPFFFYGSFGIGAVTMSAKGQRFGDLMAGTTVIKMERRISMADTMFTQTQEGYQLVYPEVSRLSDTDVNTLTDVLRLYQRERNLKLLNITANRVCHILGVIPQRNQDAETFIRHIIYDYNHAHK